MIELTEWLQQAVFPSRPWLMLGKGPTFERRDQFRLDEFNLVALNHVVNEVKVAVAHIVDVDVVPACSERLVQNCEWLVMPRYPHLNSTINDRPLESWFDEMPVLRELHDRGKLVWYNLSGNRREGRSPVVGSKRFSSEAVLTILGLMGARTVRSLGVDGGRSYASTFKHLEDETLLANGAPSFDSQFERLAMIAEERGIDYKPLVEPFRIFLGTDDSQIVAHRVLEYSITKSASAPVAVTPMLNVRHRMPKDPANKPRTTFSFCRFMIPKLCGYQGRALYLDADMLVFGDIAELMDMPFGGKSALCTAPAPTEQWEGHNSTYLGKRSVAVMLLDCERLKWDVDEIVDDLDAGRYTYQQLLSDVCVVPPDKIADTIPPEWNDLERYDPAHTKLTHFTVVPTQPWKNDDNPLNELWMAWYREAVEAGAVPPEEVEASIAAGHVKPSLAAALRFAPARRTVLTGPALELNAARQRIAALEGRIQSMEQSWSWRLGDGIVRRLRKPVALARKVVRR